MDDFCYIPPGSRTGISNTLFEQSNIPITSGVSRSHEPHIKGSRALKAPCQPASHFKYQDPRFKPS